MHNITNAGTATPKSFNLNLNSNIKPSQGATTVNLPSKINLKGFVNTRRDAPPTKEQRTIIASILNNNNNKQKNKRAATYPPRFPYYGGKKAKSCNIL